MNKNKSIRRFGSFTIVILCLFFTIGCTSKYISGWWPFLYTEEKNNQLQRDAGINGPHLTLKTLTSLRGNPGSHYQLALYYQQRDRHLEAVKEFKKAVLIDPAYVMAYNGMGMSYDIMGKYTEAVTSYKTALMIEPNSDYVLNNLGYSYILQNNIDQAVASLKKAVALNNLKTHYHNNLAIAYAMKGRFQEAMDECRLAGDRAEVHYKIADIYYQQGSYSHAKSHYEQILNIAPSYKDVPTRLKAAAAMSRIAQEQDINTGQQIKTVLDNTRKIPAPVAPVITTDKESQNYLAESEVEISNGNGVNRMAREVGNFLRKKGVRVTKLTNADNFDHRDTTIYYRKGNNGNAVYLAEILPGIQYYKESLISDSPSNIKVRVIIGKDLVTSKNTFRSGS